MSENFSFQFIGVKIQVLQSEINPLLPSLPQICGAPPQFHPSYMYILALFLLVSVCVSVIATTILQSTPSMVDYHIS